MLRSMEKYGQMTPVVVSRMERGHYELLDGFKRLRELDWEIDQQHGRGPCGAFPLS
jgi:hypothetical protein